MKSRRWLWVTLFISALMLLGGLATGWNVVLVRDYLRMVDLAKGAIAAESDMPWIKIVVGSSGFAGALGIIILFFFRLLREMRINQLQSEFLATVSHELRTPIAAIELSSDLLRKGGLTEAESIELWDSHGMELQRLRAQVDELLEAARWQSGEVRLDRTAMELESWITESMKRWRSILGPGATLTREGDPLPVHALLDARTLNLVTDNILDNARKFSRGQPNVVVRTHRFKDKWQIEFADRGWGFDPSDRERIFTRFFRARTGSDLAIPGTGLGLYLATQACAALGLQLRGESAGKGTGARFTLEGPEAGP